MNAKLYFTADDGNHGREPWASDGTLNGTQLISDINPLSVCNYYGRDLGSGTYPCNSEPGGYILMDNKLYFAADDGSHGLELWAISVLDVTIHYQVFLPLVLAAN